MLNPWQKALKKMKEAPELVWVCPKCGLERSNKKTHRHGEPL